MSYITEERSDAELLNQLPTFVSRAIANSTVLGLDADQIQELSSLVTGFSTSMGQVQTTRNAAKSAVKAKNGARGSVRSLVGQLAKTWRANPAIPESVLADMNVPPRQGQGSTTPPVTPSDLSYSINTQGVATLRWKRNGNKQGTVFNVERSSNGVSNWAVVNTSTTTRAVFQTTPGVTVYYRVVAIRGQQSSTPTNPIVVWPTAGNGDETTLFEAA